MAMSQSSHDRSSVDKPRPLWCSLVSVESLQQFRRHGGSNR
uniref:Uncharacterized protein n=1 Tax=Siphoviridae sp. ctevH2 TaxID=2825593 RepID=A0A8S5UAP8_9CAUD|nr:MAG TPA: hypothetical protein [Siphoviridae sp. ctevH2]